MEGCVRSAGTPSVSLMVKEDGLCEKYRHAAPGLSTGDLRACPFLRP